MTKKGSPGLYKALNRLILCPLCHTLHEKVTTNEGEKAICSSCGKTLYENNPNLLNRNLALGITGIILFVLANIFPLVQIELLGHQDHMTIISMIVSMFDNRFYLAGIVVAFMLIVFPSLILIAYVGASWLMKRGKKKELAKELLVLLAKAIPWSMMEIYFVGILVALVKLFGHLQIHFGLSFWALLLFVVLDIYIIKNTRFGELWEFWERVYRDK